MLFRQLVACLEQAAKLPHNYVVTRTVSYIAHYDTWAESPVLSKDKCSDTWLQVFVIVPTASQYGGVYRGSAHRTVRRRLNKVGAPSLNLNYSEVFILCWVCCGVQVQQCPLCAWRWRGRGGWGDEGIIYTALQYSLSFSPLKLEYRKKLHRNFLYMTYYVSAHSFTLTCNVKHFIFPEHSNLKLHIAFLLFPTNGITFARGKEH